MEAFSVRSVVHDALKRVVGEEADTWLDDIVFGWSYNDPIAAYVCKPKRIFRDFNLEQWSKDYDAARCPCRSQRYEPLLSSIPIELIPGSTHQHVVTMSPEITDNYRLRAMLKEGLNHVPLKALDIEEALYEMGQLLDRLADASVGVLQLSDRKRRLMKKLALDKARTKMSRYWNKHRHVSAEPIDQASIKKEIEFISRRFLVLATDKAANTPTYVCVNFIRELALQRLSSPDFVLLHEEPELLEAAMHAETAHLVALPRTGVNLPYLMAIFKAHKGTFRWITNTANSSVSAMAEVCACLLSFLVPSVRDFCEEKSLLMEAEYGTKPNLWWPVSSIGEFAASLPQMVSSVYTADITRCFELIPTDSSEHSLVAAVKFFVECAMAHRRDRSSRDSIKIRVTNGGSMFASWTDKHLCPPEDCMHFTEKEVVWVTEWCVSHSLVQMGGEVWKQVLGIPMGLACSPVWCDVYFFKYEYQAMIRLLEHKLYESVQSFRDTFRYVDDICSLNNAAVGDCFRSECDQIADPKWIYPAEYIEIKETTVLKGDDGQGIVANFLNMTISVSSAEQGEFATAKCDKRHDLGFVPCRYTRFNSNRSTAQSLQIITAQTALILILCTDPTEATSEIRRVVAGMTDNGYESRRCWDVVKKVLKNHQRYQPSRVNLQITLEILEQTCAMH
ncbi:hypothetical protein CBR_g29879 [Chara braunii]|uniref:Reverse transcriptase domain-containing protein n=1 Tax=Chara braunii TaxID=69332 RepID=A0A388JWT6_CHABU|nr:hypothetical protein CBR_g29879 [Chara braunii]|eukprot:GBG62271.1 hypothetical protein CBR_g29879 [Chara braunii]